VIAIVHGHDCVVVELAPKLFEEQRGVHPLIAVSAPFPTVCFFIGGDPARHFTAVRAPVDAGCLQTPEQLRHHQARIAGNASPASIRGR
jgi:hypothetical protein